jgi:DNA gyrase inhibitor GyrI
MDELEVRIVKLEPMRVASVWGFGKEPETEAWAKLEAWAKPKGLFDPAGNDIYGFNNPDPSPGSPNYGYELWVKVGPDIAPEDDVRLKDFGGGLYAVARCEIPSGNYEVIGTTWKKLVTWREASTYKSACHQWLEKSVPNDKPGIEFILDLYLPIAE